MASMVARALIEDVLPGAAGADDLRRGIDRVLDATFWRPSPRTAPACVISITSERTPALGPKPR